MTHLEKITQYFIRSLVDAERLSPQDKDLLPALGVEKSQSPHNPHLALNRHIWQDGRIDASLAKQLIATKQLKAKTELKEIELVLFPRVDQLTFRGGNKSTIKRVILLPLVVFVRLQIDGVLKPGSKAPWVPRDWLAPNQSATEPIGDLDFVDEFLTQNPYEGIGSWRQLTAYCVQLLSAATGFESNATINKSDVSEMSLFEIPIHQDYTTANQCLLQTEVPISGVTDKIRKVYDFLLGVPQAPLLYERFCADNSSELGSNIDLQYDALLSRQHIGQMTGEFPLSPKQRNALHHGLKLREGEILAVNGPPGTGKTTLLRTVVANLWAQAALDENEPPLIVAASNNNQAITNILESFAKIDEGGLEENLKGRWLPEVASYGLYCCAGSLANKDNPYLYLGPNGDGCMQNWQTRKYLDGASAFFLKKVSDWHGSTILDIALAKKYLHEALVHSKERILEGQNQLAAFSQIEADIVKKFGSHAALIQTVSSAEKLSMEAKIENDFWHNRLVEMYSLWNNRSIWVRMLLWWPPINKYENRKNSLLLHQWELHLEKNKDAAVEAFISSIIRECRGKFTTINARLAELKKYKNEYEEAHTKIKSWVAKQGHVELSAKTLVGQVNEVNDRINRFALFKIATHYWESRWLIEYRQL